MHSIGTFVRGLAICCFALALLTACGGGGGGGGAGGGSPASSGTTPTLSSLANNLMFISVTPGFPASMAKGLTQQFLATGYYLNGASQDITSSVTWNSASPSIATVDAKGLAKGTGVGSTTITATLAGVSSTFVSLTVTPAVVTAIAVTPGNASATAGLSRQFTATGTYSDGTTQDITGSVSWGSNNWAVASINTSGLAMGISAGTANITATKSGGFAANVSGSTTLTVANYIISGTLSLLPAANSVVLQNNGLDNLTLAANGTFTFNTPLATAATYNVSVLTQPPAPAHTCYVVDGYGTVTNFYITSVQVVCGMAVSTLAGSGTMGAANGTGTASTFYWPNSVAVDTAGNVYVADTFNNLIRKITPAGVVSTLAGSGAAGAANGTGAAATFNAPQGIAVDTAGNVYVADTNNFLIRKITPAGVVSTFAGIAGVGGFGSFANGPIATATFCSPTGIAVDAAGNVYVSEPSNSLIRKISAGTVSTLAGVYTVSGAVNGAGTVATFNFPGGITVDTAGNVYVADSFNNLIRKITPAGVVSTLAGSGVYSSVDGTGTAATFSRPTDVAVDTAGNVYVAESYLIRKITPAGVVTTMAGTQAGAMAGLAKNGPAPTATFWAATGVAVDAAGNWYVADQGNNMIRKIMP